MPFDSALNSTQYEYLRGDSDTPAVYSSAVYLSVCANTNVYTGRVNQSTFAVPLDEFTFDGGSGTSANVKANMTLLISHTNDRFAAHFRGRTRGSAISESGGAGTVYTNETGADIQDNDYFWIINDFAIHEILPRDVAGKPVPDVDTTFRQLKPIITGLQSVYVFWISDGSGLYSKAYAPTVTPAADGATNSSYLWTIPSGATITVGASTDKDVTIRFNAGFADWITFQATDSNGVQQTFRFHVWAHDPDNMPTVLSFEQFQTSAEIPINPNEGAGTGYNATVTAFDDVDTLLDQTLVCAWTIEKYNGTAISLGSQSNILMAGRFRSESNQSTIDQTEGQLDAVATFEIEGALRQLERLRFPALEILRTAGTPTEFNEVKDLTLWRAIWLILSEYSTFGSLHQVKFDSTAETYLIPGITSQGGDLLYGVADACQRFNAVIQCNAAGMCEVARRAVMLPTGDRSGLTTVANFATADYLAIEYRRDYFQPIGFLRGSGGGYNSDSGITSAYDVRAPRGVPSGGAGEAQLHRQVLTANLSTANERAELEQRAGDALAAQQSPEVLSVTLTDQWHWLTPDVKQWYTWTLAATETVRGKAFTTSQRWWLQSIDVSHDAVEGTKEVRGIFVLETDGVDGQVIDYPQVALGEYPVDAGEWDELPQLPPSNEFDEEVDPCDLDLVVGTCAASEIESDCSGGRSLINGVKLLDDIYTIQSITLTYTATATIASPSNYVSLWVSGNFERVVYKWTTEAGSNQTITINVGGIPADHIRIVLYGDDNACSDTITLTGLTVRTVRTAYWRETFDFTLSDYGWELEGNSTNGEVRGQYVAGSGWQVGLDSGGFEYYVGISNNPPKAGNYTRIRLYVTSDEPENTAAIFDDEPPAAGGSGSTLEFVEDFTDEAVVEWTGSQSLSDVYAYLRNGSTSPPNTGSDNAYITKIVLEGTGINPYR